MSKDSTPNAREATGAAKRRSPARLALAMVGVVVLIVSGLFIWQSQAAQSALDAVAEFEKNLERSGVAVAHQGATTSGAPARVDLFFGAPEASIKSIGAVWKAARLEIRRLVYRSKLSSLSVAGPHQIETPFGSATLEGDLRGSLSKADRLIENVSLALRDAALMPDGAESARTIKEAELHLRPHDAPTTSVHWTPRFYLTLDSMALRDGGRVSAIAEGVVEFTSPLADDGALPALVAIEVSEAKILLTSREGEQAIIVASGKLKWVDGKLQGTLGVESDAAPEALASLASGGALSEPSAEALAARIAQSGRLAGVLAIDGGQWRMLDLQPEAIPLKAPR